MNVYKKILLISLFIGILLAFYYFNKIKNDVLVRPINNDSIYLFQLGVYANYNNALNTKSSYPESIIYNDNNKYHVIIGICYSNDVCKRQKKYYDEQNIQYYLKEYIINNKFINEIENYEKIIVNTDKKDVIQYINRKINNIFISYLNK